DPALIDGGLSGDMAALLRLVTLASAARNAVKTKVRQPLAELRVLPGTEAERRAVERFADLLRDEQNVKRVGLHEPQAGPLLTAEVSPNRKTLGPKFGARLQEVIATLQGLPVQTVLDAVAAGSDLELPCPGGPVTIGPGDVTV